MMPLRSLIFALAILPHAACMTWTRVPLSEIPTEIHAKDTVRLKTLDGRRLRFVVRKVEPVALLGKKVRVRFGEIEWLEKGRDRTWEIVGGVAVGTLAIGLTAGLALVAVAAAMPPMIGHR